MVLLGAVRWCCRWTLICTYVWIGLALVGYVLPGRVLSVGALLGPAHARGTLSYMIQDKMGGENKNGEKTKTGREQKRGENKKGEKTKENEPRNNHAVVRLVLSLHFGDGAVLCSATWSS